MSSIRIVKIHICNLEKNGENSYKINLEKYPVRLCVIDEERGIVVDVETNHQYPYIKEVNRQYFRNSEALKNLNIGDRIACCEYHVLLNLELDSKSLNKCAEIIKQLKSGAQFKDGNKELTNSQYLEIINNEKINQKSKKIYKKRK